MSQVQKSRKNSRISIKVPTLWFREENPWLGWFCLKATPSAMRPISSALSPQLPSRSWRNTRRRERSSARSWTSRKRPTTPPIVPYPNTFPQVQRWRASRDPWSSPRLRIWLSRWGWSMRASWCSRPTSSGWVFSTRWWGTIQSSTNDRKAAFLILIHVIPSKFLSFCNNIDIDFAELLISSA